MTKTAVNQVPDVSEHNRQAPRRHIPRPPGSLGELLMRLREATAAGISRALRHRRPVTPHERTSAPRAVSLHSKALTNASKRVRKDLSCGVTGGIGRSIDSSE
jgi:hypothetical protein